MFAAGGGHRLRIGFVASFAAAVLVPVAAWGENANDPLAAGRRLRERISQAGPLRETSSGITRDAGAIAIIEHDGTDYSRLEPDGTPNYAARARVTQRFYADHGDRYDFVVVFTNFPFDTAGAVGFHSLVRNDVAGIGLPPVNNGPLFGSPGRLKGYVDMGTIDQYRFPPFSTEPGHPGFGDAVDVLAHEMGHQWLARIRYRNSSGIDSPDLLGIDGSHWSYLLDSDASLFYGSDWTPAGNGVFRASRVSQAYSSLDLYLMGFLDPARVAPFTLLRNPAVSPAQLPNEGATLSATPESVDIGQVVAAESPRVPDHRASQKDFRVGFVFLAAPGADPTTEDLEAVDRLRDSFSARFFALTRGVAFADTTLAEEVLPPPAPVADLDRALAWLRTRQALDGRWEDSPGTPVRDTVAALDALDAAGETVGAFQRAQVWLEDAPVASVDFLARRAKGRALDHLPTVKRNELIAAILSHANVDGGFGAARGYESDALDTALALSALHDLGATADVRVRGAFAALALLKPPEGGWALVPGRGPSSMATAQVLLALHDWRELPEAASLLTTAIASLTGRQNEDGGFGESPSTAHGTALALIALDRAGAPATIVDRATAWLQRAQAADGSWQGRSYETALAIAALKGRTAANLVIRQDDVTLDPASAEEGEVVRVTVRVRNLGRLAAPPTIARLYDGAPASASAVDEEPLPAVEPGQDATIVLEFPTSGRPGTHTLSVQADADGVVTEVREDDNTASRSLEIAGPMPDLAIRMSDIVVAPYPPEAGETVRATVTVVNRGDRVSDPNQLRLYRGHPGSGGIAIGQATLPTLAPGAAIASPFDWTVTGPPGSTQLVAVSDATFAVLESDETNNLATVPVVVTGPVGPGPDLEIPLVEAAPVTLSSLPQSIAVRVVVRNQGRDAVSSTVALFEGAVTGSPISEQPVTLAPRTSTILEIPFVVASPGTRTLTAIADRAGLVSETSETNNQAWAVVTDPGNTLDLAIDAVTPSSTDLTIGETLSVQATVRNRGTMPIVEVPVVLAHVVGGAIGELDRSLVTLAAGSSATVHLSWTTSLTGDPVPLAAIADPFDLLVEGDEVNNRRDLAVRVRPSELTNLHLTGADLSFEPDPPLEGGSATLRARVINPSPVAAGPFAVRFFLGDPAAGGRLLGESAVVGVAAHSEAMAEVLWDPVDVQGGQGIHVVADANGAVEEYDETDNVAFRPFQVIGLPDLTLSSAELALQPAFPRSGEPVTVRATIRNLGAQPAGASLLRLFEGEPASGIPVGDSAIPPLAPGASVSVELAWTPSAVGVRLLIGVADAEGAITEGDEGNNQGRREVVVQDADFYTTAPYFSPDGDGSQDDTTLAYRATVPVSILVWDSRGRLVRTLATAAPLEGSVTWDGRDDRGRLMGDGTYALTLRTPGGAVLARLEVVLDTNRSPIHDAAGTGLVALRTIDAAQTNARGPAWMPAEDEVVLIIPSPDPLAGFSRGLLRWRLDGARSYVSEDSWYDPLVRFASADAVSADGREVLVVKDGEVLAVDLLSGARRVVAPGNEAHWSPDGQRILVGAEVLARDGTPQATLPFAGGTWSPDGEELIAGVQLVRRDGMDLRQVPLPVEIEPTELVGAPCFMGSIWRGDGRIVLRIGRWTAHEHEATVISCDADRVFTYDPAGGASQEATVLRGLPASDQWSPDGSRLLHPALAGDTRDVTRENAGPSLQIWPGPAEATPRSSAAFFCFGGPQTCSPYVARLSTISNLLNLAADLSPTPLPASRGVLLKGTVTDANLDRWQIDYAHAAGPTVWHPIGGASSVPVVDGILATWVPSAPGAYLVRLLAWDRAGAQRTVIRTISWSQTPSLANLTQSERLISPNDDGIKDAVRFDFLVQEPTRLEATISGPVPPAGTPGQPPVVRRFSVDLPTIGPGGIVWDGRDVSGQRVADGRYAVALDEVPFEVEVDATPPEIGLQHDNLRLVTNGTTESPGEVLASNGECASAQVQVGVPGLDRHWYVVDASLKRWAHGLEGGTAQVYEPERDGNGQIVYVGGVPQVRRLNGRPVFRDGTVAEPFWPGTLEAEDLGGNRSALASAPVPTELFVTGLRPMPRCLPAGVPIPANRQLADGPVKVHPRTRFFVRGAPGDVFLKRFEYRESESAPWSPGPSSDLLHDGFVDVDLLALGLLPGRSYRGRFASVGGAGLASDEFTFRICTESVNIRVGEAEPIAGTSQSRYVVDLDADVSQPLSSARLVVTGAGALQGFALQMPFERTGPTTYRVIVAAPNAGCSASGTARVLSFEAVVRDGSGAPLASDGSCLNLVAQVGRCAGQLEILEEKLACEAASPDRVVLKVRAQGADPSSLVTLAREGANGPLLVGEPFAIGPEQTCGTVPGPNGPAPLYCDERLVSADVAGVPEGSARFEGRVELMPPSSGIIATADVAVAVDRTAPAIVMSEPPEGGSSCVERNGQVENVRLALAVTDAVPSVAVTSAAYRYGEGSWQRMCLDGDCGPWRDLPTGSVLEKLWDVRGLVDGGYEVRVDLCDHSGNRTSLLRTVSITRGGTAIELASVVNPDFSPNGDGRADDTRVRVRLPQTLRLVVDVRSDSPNGPSVRRLVDQQFTGGTHEFAWDGRDGTGALAPDGSYFLVAEGTNACGGTAGVFALVRLDTTPPDAEVTLPLSGALLNTSSDVLGRAADARFGSYSLAFGAGAAPGSWTGISSATTPVGTGGAAGLLGLFQPPAAEGVYTLRLQAHDRALNKTEVRTVVNVGPRAFLERFTVGPSVFSPNGDGRRETVTIEYELLVPGQVTLDVLDAGGGLLRRLESGLDRPAGAYALVWDGRKDDASPAPEGDHQVHIRVVDPAGPASPQEQFIGLRLDATAPVVSIANPVTGAFLRPGDFVRGTVTDTVLREFVVSAERPFSPTVELARGSQNQVDADLAPLTPLAAGPYQLVLAAEDAGENRAEVRIPFAVDAADPHALIEAPRPGAVVARGALPIAVTGSALDANLESYEVGFGAGTAPSDFIPIATGTQAVAGGLLASWNVAGVTDGAYVLRLVVRDRAGRSADSRSAIVLDGRPPDAAILAPTADAFLNAESTITGTASDETLEAWRIEAAPGEISTAFQWSLLSEGTQSVVVGALAEWAPLPPEGRHTLRLTVRDRAGHESSVLRAITVDTSPPGAPANLTSIVRRDGATTTADVELEWTPNGEQDLAGYRLTRNGVAVSAGLLQSALHTDQDLPEGNYSYLLRAVDRAGNVGPPTPHTARVDLSPPTVALLEPAAASSVSGAVEVRGTAFSLDDFAQYRLLAGEGAAPFTWTEIRRSTVPVSVGLLGIWTPTHGGLHVLALEATDEAGNEARVTASVTVDHVAPLAPVLASVENVPQPDALTSTWPLNGETDVSGYLIYRNGRIANAPALVIGNPRPYLVPGPVYVDVPVPDGQHCYRVVAMDQAGNLSPPSNEICRPLDNRAPQALLVEPPDGARFEFPLRLSAMSPDLDVVSVRFEMTPAAGSDWTAIGSPDTAPPFEATLDPIALSPGAYRLQAVARDAGGREDVAPASITVTYGDTSAPAPPSGLVVASDGDVVSLSWNAGSEPDLDGYHVYRDGQRLTTDPQAGTTFVEVRAPGGYEYGVTAVDTDGNESLPSIADAEVYQLALDPVLPLVTGGPVTLIGGGARTVGGSVEIVRGGVLVGQAPAGSDGSFAVPGVPLQPGANVLAARERDSAGHASLLSDEVVAISNAPPGPIVGLTASVSALDVTLGWDAATDPDAFGYAVRRDGEDQTGLREQADVFQVTASSSLEQHEPHKAFDGDPETSWIPALADRPAYWMVDFVRPTPIGRVDLVFQGSAGPVPAPAHRIEVEWEGRLLPLLEAPAGTDAHVSHLLPLPFATARMRVAIEPATYVGLSEATVWGFDLVPAATPTFSQAVPDGIHTYEVAAIDRYGARGQPANVQVVVGDVEAPPVPTGLQASANGSDVGLAWQSVSAGDLSGYAVYRDGVVIGQSTVPSYLDSALPNGAYTYTVRSRDTVGNQSADSMPATATVFVAVPPAPVLSADTPLTGGVSLSWTHPGAPGFVVQRALLPGGPYAAVAQTGDRRDHLDLEVRPGATYSYVVRGLDAAGNVSSPSNAVIARPLAPRPAMLRPTDADHPITLGWPVARFGGRAWEGALVALTVNGELRGVAHAGGAFEEVDSIAVPDEGFAPRLSPDGRTLAFAAMDGDVPRARWVEWATGQATQAQTPSIPSAFSGDGRRLAYLARLCDATGCQSDLHVVDLDTSVVTRLEEGPSDSQESAWSPGSDRIAIVTWSAGASRYRVRVLDVVTGQDTTVLEGAGAPSDLRWAPAGDEIALLQWNAVDERLVLLVVPMDGGAPLEVADTVGWSSASWMPTGRTIVYTSVAGARPRLRSWDLATGAVTDVTDGTTSSSGPRIDAQGERLSYVRSDEGSPVRQALVVRELTTSTEHAVAEWVSDYPLVPSVHEWLRDGYLAVLLDGRVRLVPSFDGAFFVPDVALEPGVNLVEAEGIEETTGAVSASSGPIAVTVPSSLFPDLSVVAADLGAYPTIPIVGQPSVLHARVRNLGQAAVAGSEVHVSLFGPGGVVIDQTAEVGEVAPGGSNLVSAYWTPTAPGTYLLRAKADPAQEVIESREDNNEADAGLFVLAGSELAVQVTADRLTYTANASALLTVELTNGGPPFSGTLRTLVTTEAGAIVSQVDDRALSIGYGQTRRVDLSWNTGATLAGDYLFEVQALEDGTLRARATFEFRIEPDVSVWARVTPDDPTVPLGGSAVVLSRVENRGANTPLAGATMRLQIAPQAGGAPVFVGEEAVPALPPGAAWERAFEWSPASPAGVFVARLEIAAPGGSVLASATAPLEVRTSGLIVTGTLALSPSHVLQGATSQARAIVTNRGMQPLVGQAFALDVTNGASPLVLLHLPFVLDVPAGATREAELEIPSGSLAAGPYLVFLRLLGDPQSLDRAVLRVHSNIAPPSVDSPVSGTSVPTAHPTLRVNNAVSPGGAPLLYEFALFRDEALTLPLPGAIGIPETPDRTAWTVQVPLAENDRYLWRARASDGFSNSAWTPVASFRVDHSNEAPTAPTPDTPVPGARVASLQPTLIVANAFDPELDPITYDFRLATDASMTQVVGSASGVVEGPHRTAWTVPIGLVENAHYYWSVRARDASASSAWTVPIGFQVDLTNESPSATPMLRPADDAEVVSSSPELALGAASDPEGDALVYRIEVDRVPTFDSSDKQVSPDLPLQGGEASWTAPVPLPDNRHAYWRGVAYDGHTSGPWSVRRFFVNAANDPPLAPVPLDPGAGSIVATQTPTLVAQNAVDPDLDLLTYSFEVRDAADAIVASAGGVAQLPGQTSWLVSELLTENGSFSWRTRAHDGEAYGPWSPDVAFRINSTNDPPTAPTLVAPTQGAIVTIARPGLIVANASSPDLLPLSYTFELYRLDTAGDLTLVASASGLPSGSTHTSWTADLDLTDGEYSWRARADDATQPGPWMPSARFDVRLDLPPAPPVGLVALAGDARVDLAWSANPEPDVTGYRVYRAFIAGGPYSLAGAAVTPAYSDVGLVNGQPVFYVITAVDAAFESGFSVEVTAAPMATPLVADVVFWPAVVDGECLECPPPGRAEARPEGATGAQPLTPVLECVRSDGSLGLTAFFGFENPNATVVSRPIGPQNAFDPAPADRGQPTLFGRGRSPEFPGVFQVHLTNPRLTWWLDGNTATAAVANAVKNCPLPLLACPQWLYATIEPPPGHDPAAIAPPTVRLAGVVAADEGYQALVDRDGDGLLEREVRFPQLAVRPLLSPGTVPLTVTGAIAEQSFAGSGGVRVAEPKARLEVWPFVLSRSQPSPDLRVWLTLRECFAGSGIDIGSLRLNGVVPVADVLGVEADVLKLVFNRSAVMAVLPLGDRQELVLTGTAQGQPFRAVDLVRVTE